MSKKILITIVDDDLDDQLLLKEAIEATNIQCEVNSVYNGMQLMDFLLKREHYKNIEVRPDLIFLDLNMPILNGLQTLEKIYQSSEFSDIPIVVLSTSSNELDKSMAISLGAKSYFVKPYSAKQLQEIVYGVLTSLI